MFSKEMEALIEATLQDGVLTDQEKAVLVKRAQKEGIDIDELDIYIQSLMQKRHQAEAEQYAAEDRKAKMGNLKRCPSCGEIVQPGNAICPMCGYAFNQIEATSSAIKLVEHLQKLDETLPGATYFNIARGKYQTGQSQKMEYIRNFPVPNSREDLLDLLTSLQPKANKLGSPKGWDKNGPGMTYHSELSLAYWDLFCNCINKARISFASDDAFKYAFDFYDQESAKKKSFFARLFGK